MEHETLFSMWTLVLFLPSLLPAGVSAVTPVTGYKGHSGQIKCSYKSGYETNIKYLCRGECPYLGTRDISVQSGSAAKDLRFSLEDNTTARVFTVTINDLRTEDGGRYWCGVERSGPDDYTEILLHVNTDAAVSHSTASPSPVQTQFTYPPYRSSTDHADVISDLPSTSSLSTLTSVLLGPTHSPKASLDSLIYITGGLVIMVVTFLVAVMALYKHKKKNKKSKAPAEMSPPMPASPIAANPREDDGIYQDTEKQQQKPAMESTVNTIYSTAEEPADAPVYSTVKKPTDIYSTAILV
ncbi:uncharacterized protein [Salminus brasiliensis]|uniref:uncharacterized protein n=1 Tax=Salminus brasiliensis TaxID=930266 RepID=UPI003B830DC5